MSQANNIAEEQKSQDKCFAAPKIFAVRPDVILDDSNTASTGNGYVGENFYAYENGKFDEVTLKLDLHQLIAQDKNDSGLTRFYIEDVIGATSKPLNPESKKRTLDEKSKELASQMHVLRVYLLIKHEDHTRAEKHESDKEGPHNRVFKKFIFFSKDKSSVDRWANLILQASNNPNFKDLYSKHSVSDFPQFATRRLLVFICANSGKGEGPKLWDGVKKYLVHSGVEFVERPFEKNPEVREYFEKTSAEEIKKFSCFIGVSGDGSPHEIINGILERPDWKELNHIPIMLVPAGSCNALTKNLCDFSQEPPTTEGVAYLIAKARTTKGDVTVYERANDKKIYSFLSFIWAVPANIDQESKILRPLGHLRMDVWGLWELLRLKTYKAKFSYSSTAERPPPLNEPIQAGEDWKVIDDEFSFFYVMGLPWEGLGEHPAPFAEVGDGYNYFVILKGEEVTRKNLLQIRLELMKPNRDVNHEKEWEKRTGVKADRVKSYRLEPDPKNPGLFDIDGEEFKSEPIQCHIMRNAITYIAYEKKATKRDPIYAHSK